MEDNVIALMPAATKVYLRALPPLERAIALAAIGHAGQKDLAGEPYILHVLRVMLRTVATCGSRSRAAVVAPMHDLCEDTALTPTDLSLDYGFEPEIAASVEALTKREGENRLDAARRACEDDAALEVKIADNADNTDPERVALLGEPTPRGCTRQAEYAAVGHLLKQAWLSRSSTSQPPECLRSFNQGPGG